MKEKILVVKENGEQEVFDVGKLIQSLQRSGASETSIRQVVAEVEGSLQPMMLTRDIYRKAFGLLRKIERHVAARYSLKRALLELGPSGFPFEDFIGEIFKTKGFEVSTRMHLKGLCVEHEVDFVAKSSDKKIVGEAKFHNVLGMKTDLKVALYVGARVEDIKKSSPQTEKIEGWLVTNTKFTKSAVQYAECANLKIVGWTYPRFGSLQDLIEEARIHPLTCLTTLSKSEKMNLMSNGVVLCKSIGENKQAFENIGIKGRRLENVLNEGRLLCNPI